MKYDKYAPDGFFKLTINEVWTNGKSLVLIGEPDESDDEESTHNCDRMGCGSFSHVVLVADIPEAMRDIPDLYRPKAINSAQELDCITETKVLV